MRTKLNCWEFKNCGRQRGGLMADLLGACIVPEFMKYDGLNDGSGAGRACWMVPHSVTDGHNRRTATCSRRCYTCEFYKRVVFEQEEDTKFRFTSIKV
ncbi:MAG: hypothetical protein JSW34_11190 [Candidatus Zixiibacteriota bacterium]|nr:MAG: hypothetical protein JSW34_11190 [candidate division Zixibacteria bacterium]